MELEQLLEQFAAAVGAHDSSGLAALFCEDGVYDDYFFGAHKGRSEIAAMLDRFHVGGEAFYWQFHDLAQRGELAYASYLFSYLSREPESPGKMIVFEGIARLRLRDGLIAHYAEVFDRGVAFTQLGYPGERIGKLLTRYAGGFTSSDAVQGHIRQRAASLA
ncbi:MAG: nuclear transport factor 2 family protein [Quisquiliibacterium sp.]